jgi:SAM-dependent methyltransferase
VRDHLVVEQDPVTGARLKRYFRPADVDYWTERWDASPSPPYERERRGHLPHQLRSTFRRWVVRGAKTLEAGCGLGHFTIAAAALGYRAEGLDWSEPTIDRLRRQFDWIPWHVGDVRQLPFSDDSFDAVYSPGVCEHFAEGPVAVLEETRRVLRGGGFAIVSTPCFNGWLQRRADRLSRPSAASNDDSRPVDESAFHEYAFSPAGMADLLGRIGFDVLQIRPYGTLDTLVRFGGWRVPGALEFPLAVSMDYLPVVRNWGSTCIWVARKR